MGCSPLPPRNNQTTTPLPPPAKDNKTRTHENRNKQKQQGPLFFTPACFCLHQDPDAWSYQPVHHRLCLAALRLWSVRATRLSDALRNAALREALERWQARGRTGGIGWVAVGAGSWLGDLRRGYFLEDHLDVRYRVSDCGLPIMGGSFR